MIIIQHTYAMQNCAAKLFSQFGAEALFMAGMMSRVLSRSNITGSSNSSSRSPPLHFVGRRTYVCTHHIAHLTYVHSVDGACVKFRRTQSSARSESVRDASVVAGLLLSCCY